MKPVEFLDNDDLCVQWNIISVCYSQFCWLFWVGLYGKRCMCHLRWLKMRGGGNNMHVLRFASDVMFRNICICMYICMYMNFLEHAFLHGEKCKFRFSDEDDDKVL